MPSAVTTAVASALPPVVGEGHVARARRGVRGRRERGRVGGRATAAVAPFGEPEPAERRGRRRRRPQPATATAIGDVRCRVRHRSGPAAAGDSTVGGASRSGGGVVEMIDLEALPHAVGRRATGVGEHATRSTWRSPTSSRSSGCASRYASIAARSSSSTASMRVRRQQLGDLVGSQFTIHDPSIPRSTSCARRRVSPVRIRLLMVPSGCSRMRATSR